MSNFSVPSAPQEEKESYPDIKKLQLESERDSYLSYGGYKSEVQEESKDCVKCNSVFSPSEHHIVSMTCGHKIHFHCAKEWSNEWDLQCKSCISTSVAYKKKESLFDTPEEEDIGIPVSYGTDPEVTDRINRKYKIDVINEEIAKEKERGVNRTTIAKILGVTLTAKLKYPQELNFKLLKDNGITIRRLYEVGISAPILHAHMGVTEVGQLKSLGFKKDLLETEQFKIPYMCMLYGLDFVGLKNNFKVSVNDAVSYCNTRPNELLLIGLNMKGLMLNGFSFSDLMEVKDCFSMKDWHKKIGLNKQVLLEMRKETSKIEFDWLGWPTLDAIRQFDLNTQEIKELGIDMSSIVHRIAKKTNEKHIKKEPKRSILGLLSGKH
jgi:hypothetical protein